MAEEEEEEVTGLFRGLFLGCCGRKNQSSVFMGFVHDLGWSGATISLHPGPHLLSHTLSASRWPVAQPLLIEALHTSISLGLRHKPWV